MRFNSKILIVFTSLSGFTFASETYKSIDMVKANQLYVVSSLVDYCKENSSIDHTVLESVSTSLDEKLTKAAHMAFTEEELNEIVPAAMYEKHINMLDGMVSSIIENAKKVDTDKFCQLSLGKMHGKTVDGLYQTMKRAQEEYKRRTAQ